MKRDSFILKASEYSFSRPPLNILKGMVSAYLAYPIAEKMEKRNVTSKFKELNRHYKLSFSERESLIQQNLFDTLSFVQVNVPYYRDLFKDISFSPNLIKKDIAYLNDVPLLTKDIIREQGDRLLSRPLKEIRHHVCKTGGSTGSSCFIYYDQASADYSSAITLFSRDSIGNSKSKSELHFACRFLGEEQPDWPNREDFKCFAMNRSNIFFSSLDEAGLEEIIRTLRNRRPHLVHAHPSTIYSLACYIEGKYKSMCLFDVFESSGELLEDYMREKIQKVLCCRVINRYGLAELGVMAYQFEGRSDMFVYDSEGYPESFEHSDGRRELVFTGFRNRLMPLIRYKTGDLASVEKRLDGFYLTNVTGRIHDVVRLRGKEFPTHHIQDVLDHRVGGIQEFQIDTRSDKPILRLALELSANRDEVQAKVEHYWPNAFNIKFVEHDDFVRVGHRSKFRHVVDR
ncbi:phenylacetate--CoA ligase family protein [Vibrio maerlii]|uniref:phenylacetate--CoA ligase family protein n=1 Tax=Vibrio maerlii TaxID=2231648 RepID=UPI000E3E51CD|nr:phenylacetate--CoA ligase family protein [Vibrio maerlii]